MVPDRSFAPEDLGCSDELCAVVSLNTTPNIGINQNAFDEDHILSSDRYEWYRIDSTSTISALLYTSAAVSSKFDRPSCISNSNRDVLSALRSSLRCLSVPGASGGQDDESHKSSEEAQLSPRGHQQCPGAATVTCGMLLKDCREKSPRQTFMGIGDSPRIAKLQVGVVSRVWLQNVLIGLHRLTNEDVLPKPGTTCTGTCGNPFPLNHVIGAKRPSVTREHGVTGTTGARRTALSRRTLMSRKRFLPAGQLNSKFPIFVPVDYKSAHEVTRSFGLRPNSTSGIGNSIKLTYERSSGPRTINRPCNANDRNLRPTRGRRKPTKFSGPPAARPLVTVTDPSGRYAAATIDAMLSALRQSSKDWGNSATRAVWR